LQGCAVGDAAGTPSVEHLCQHRIRRVVMSKMGGDDVGARRDCRNPAEFLKHCGERGMIEVPRSARSTRSKRQLQQNDVVTRPSHGVEQRRRWCAGIAGVEQRVVRSTEVVEHSLGRCRILVVTAMGARQSPNVHSFELPLSAWDRLDKVNGGLWA